MQISKDLVKKYKREFSLLMKEPQRIERFPEWKGILRDWALKFQEVWLKKLPKILSKESSDEEYWQKFISNNIWGFLFELKSVSSPEFSKREFESWEKRVKRKAGPVWKFLISIVERVEGSSFPEDERIEIHGFTVVLKGFSPNEGFEEWLGRFQRGLILYKREVSEKFPFLLRVKLPFILDFETNVLRDTQGTYNKNHIWINPFNAESNSRFMAHVIAHEMGHHIWQRFLNSKQREFWEKYIQGFRGNLDFRDVLQKFGGETSILSERIKREDPIMYLQLESLDFSQEFSNVSSMDDLRSLVERGIFKISVSLKPITGYAHRNPQEAFCEALGRLIAFGPRTVLEEIREGMKVLLPRMKMSSTLKIR